MLLWRRRGLSLLEALVTVALVGLALILIMGAMREYGMALRHAQGQKRSYEAASLAFDMIRSELQEALQVTIPASNTELRLTRLDPSVPRFMSPPPVGWDPGAPLVTVRYYAGGQSLWRESPIGAGSPLEVCFGVTGFECRRTPTDNVLLRISIQESRRVIPLSQEIFLPMGSLP